jgi:hypothetical protein
MATVMAVRAATGFSDVRDFRAVKGVARTAAATMMETKTVKPLKAKFLWLKSFPHRSFTSTVKGKVWFNATLSNMVFNI